VSVAAWWNRYRHRLGDEREIIIDGFYHVNLIRGPFRSRVEVRAYGIRRVYHSGWMRDDKAEAKYDEMVAQYEKAPGVRSKQAKEDR
jgi:hypothetical protein